MSEGLADNERQPLLNSNLSLRRSYTPSDVRTSFESTESGIHCQTRNRRVRDSDVFQVSRFVNANAPWYLFAMNLVAVVVNMSTVIGAFFLVLADFTFIPLCYDYKGSHKVSYQVLCSVTSVCHCTFPLLCMVMSLFVSVKNIYDARLYYECLLQSIMLDLHNEDILQSKSFWVLLLYGVAGCSMGFFVTAGGRHSATAWFYHNMAYLSPIFSFIVVLVSRWQIEYFLIPLPKFCETDYEVATELLTGAMYVPEEYLQLAFEHIEIELDGKQAEPLTTDQYFAKLRDQTGYEVESLLLSARRKDTESLKDEWAWWEKILAKLGLPPIQTYSERHQLDDHHTLVRERVANVLKESGRGKRLVYWVHALLHSKHLRDNRSIDFRRWSLAFIIIVSVIALLLLDVFMSTTATVLEHQQVLSSSSASWFRYPNLVDEDVMEKLADRR